MNSINRKRFRFIFLLISFLFVVVSPVYFMCGCSCDQDIINTEKWMIRYTYLENPSHTPSDNLIFYVGDKLHILVETWQFGAVPSGTRWTAVGDVNSVNFSSEMDIWDSSRTGNPSWYEEVLRKDKEGYTVYAWDILEVTCLEPGVVDIRVEFTKYNPLYYSAPGEGPRSIEIKESSVPFPPVNIAPVLNSIGNKVVTVGETLTFAISATDGDGDSLNYSASNLPPGATFTTTTRTFSWTPTSAQVGEYRDLRFVVRDGALEDTETITITVNAAPVIGTPEPQVSDIKAEGKIYYMALSPDKKKLYAVDLGPGGTDNQGSISVINTASNSVENVIRGLGPGFPYQIRISPDGRKAYVAITKTAGSTTTTGDNRVAIIDLTTNQVVRTLAITGTNTFGPVGLVLSPSADYTYVTHRGLGRVDGFDNTTGELVSSVANVVKNPVGLAVTPDGKKLYIAKCDLQTISVIDVSTRPYTIQQNLATGLVTNVSHAFVTLAPDGSRAYATDVGDSRIAVMQIDPLFGIPTGTSTLIQTDAANLRQLAVSPDGKKGLVASNTTQVFLLDLVNNTKIGEIPIGMSSFGVVWADLPGTVAYVSSGNNIINIIKELP